MGNTESVRNIVVVEDESSVRKLCRSHPGTTVLFVSGYSEYEEKDLNSCANPVGFYLAKPFLPSQLIRMVRQTLRSRAAPK